MNVFVVSKLAFLLAVGVVSFAGSAILGWLFAKQPGRFRIGLWWLLAVILALSCAWVNGGWPFPPRESQYWIKAQLHKSRTEIGYATEAIPFSGQIDTGNLNYSNALFVDVATLSK